MSQTPRQTNRTGTRNAEQYSAWSNYVLNDGRRAQLAKLLNIEIPEPTELEKQRAAWFAERARPGMSMTDYCELNDEVRRLYPFTPEEWDRKRESRKDIPEFVL